MEHRWSYEATPEYCAQSKRCVANVLMFSLSQMSGAHTGLIIDPRKHSMGLWIIRLFQVEPETVC